MLFRTFRGCAGAAIALTAALTAMTLFCCAFAQASPQNKPAARDQSGKVRRKLTPRQQQGLRLLKAAQAEAAGLQPDMHAFVLWQVSTAYPILSPKKYGNLLRDAFVVTETIGDSPGDENCGISETCNIKGWLQKNILSTILKGSADEAEQLLHRAEPEVRRPITEELVQYHLSRKNFDHARELLTSISGETDYPYQAAIALLRALPEERIADRLAIFSQALANFEQHGTSGAVGTEDIGTLIARCGKRLPPAIVLEAIDRVLEEAKSGKMSNLQMNMSSRQGSLSLHSAYQLRLFQLLPLLEELDPSHAERLLHDDATMQAELRRFPQGMQSLDPADDGDPSGGRNKNPSSLMTSFSTGTNAAPNSEFQARQEAQAEISRRQEEVTSEAGKNPTQAVADALTLPVNDAYGDDSSPRAITLQAIARKLSSRDPRAAKAALDEIVKLEEQLSLAQEQGLTTLPQSFLDLGDQEGAKKALRRLARIAEKLYARDHDSDDPNQAFKGMWPSTHVWRKCVQVSARISPELAEEVIAGISDAEIETFQKVAYANSMLGVADTSTSVVERFKNISRIRIMQ